MEQQNKADTTESSVQKEKPRRKTKKQTLEEELSKLKKQKELDEQQTEEYQKLAKKYIKNLIKQIGEVTGGTYHNLPCVYGIVMDNEVVYIGQTVNFEKRFAYHVCYITHPEWATETFSSSEHIKYKALNAYINIFDGVIDFIILYDGLNGKYLSQKEDLNDKESIFIRMKLPVLNQAIPNGSGKTENMQKLEKERLLYAMNSHFYKNDRSALRNLLDKDLREEYSWIYNENFDTKYITEDRRIASIMQDEKPGRMLMICKSCRYEDENKNYDV